MKYGAGSDFAREVFARSSSACMVERRTPSPFSAAGALHARIPLIAKTATNTMGIESRNRFMGLLDVRPPAFDRCRMIHARSPGLLPAPKHDTRAAPMAGHRLIMPGIDPSGKRFYISAIL